MTPRTLTITLTGDTTTATVSFTQEGDAFRVTRLQNGVEIDNRIDKLLISVADYAAGLAASGVTMLASDASIDELANMVDPEYPIPAMAN